MPLTGACLERKEGTRMTNAEPLEHNNLHAHESNAEAAESTEQTQATKADTNEPTYEELNALNEELHQQYMRLAADFDNFRKRRLSEMEQSRKYGAEHFLRNFLPVLDNFERAQKSITAESDSTTLYKTLELMQQQLVQALEETGLKRSQVVGELFDPALHEAVSQLVVEGQAPDTIIAEQQAGYCLHDKVLRHAQVIVATEAP
jgi:molecular chaperone GrpE